MLTRTLRESAELLGDAGRDTQLLVGRLQDTADAAGPHLQQLMGEVSGAVEAVRQAARAHRKAAEGAVELFTVIAVLVSIVATAALGRELLRAWNELRDA